LHDPFKADPWSLRSGGAGPCQN